MKFQKGQAVKIIGANHSGPVQAMYDLVGGVYPIEETYSDNNYIIKGYAWNIQDLSRAPHKPADKSSKMFDTNNLVKGNDNVR